MLCTRHVSGINFIRYQRLESHKMAKSSGAGNMNKNNNTPSINSTWSRDLDFALWMVKHQTLSWVTVMWGSAGTHFFSFHLQIGQKLSNASMSPFPLRPFYEKNCLPPRRKKRESKRKWICLIHYWNYWNYWNTNTSNLHMCCSIINCNAYRSINCPINMIQ